MLDVLKVLAMIILFFLSIFAIGIFAGTCVAMFRIGWYTAQEFFE